MSLIKPEQSASSWGKVLLRTATVRHRPCLGDAALSLGQGEIYSRHSSLSTDVGQIFLIENPGCENTIHFKCLTQRELSIYRVPFLLYCTQK